MYFFDDVCLRVIRESLNDMMIVSILYINCLYILVIMNVFIYMTIFYDQGVINKIVGHKGITIDILMVCDFDITLR